MTRLLAACAIAAAVLALPAGAQTFPDKLIRIIVPFTPGGANDVVAREIATGLQARFNQSAVVENKPGGGGTIGYSYVAKSPPDGHVMLVAPASFTMGPHLSRLAASFSSCMPGSISSTCRFAAPPPPSRISSPAASTCSSAPSIRCCR